MKEEIILLIYHFNIVSDGCGKKELLKQLAQMGDLRKRKNAFRK